MSLVKLVIGEVSWMPVSSKLADVYAVRVTQMVFDPYIHHYGRIDLDITRHNSQESRKQEAQHRLQEALDSSVVKAARHILSTCDPNYSFFIYSSSRRFPDLGMGCRGVQ